MCPAPVEIDFVAGGIAQVLRAFDSIEQKAERFERSFTAQSASGSRSREGTTKKEIDYRAKELQRLVKDAEAREKEMVRDADRASMSKAKSAETAAKSATKAAERESKNRQKIAVEEARVEERVFAQSLRERERMAKAATRVEESAAADRRRIAEREANQAEATERRWSRRYGRSMGTAAVGSVGRTLSGAASLIGGALTVGGGFAVAGALREEMSFGEAVAQTSNAAFVEGDPRRTREKASPEMIAALARHVEIGTNISKLDAVQALHKYVNLASDLSGMSEINPETGRSNLEEMGRISKGSGAAFGDLMTAAGYLKAQNPAMTSADLNLRMRQMVGAGAKGDIAIADMAKYANLATANSGQFVGDLGANQAKMLGLTQIAGRVADPAQAAEAVNKLAFDVSKHADKMSAAGISVTDKSGKILSPETLISNLFAATGGNVGKLSDLGIDARSMKVFEGLTRNYDEAEAIKKGSGAAAVRREVADYQNINFSQGAADTNFKNVMGTDEERISGVLNHFKEVVAGAAIPAFEKFVTKLVDHQSDLDVIINGLGKLATALAEDPLGTGAKIMAAKIAADVAQAGIGQAIKIGILKMFEGGGAGGGGVAGLAGAGGRMGAMGGMAGSALGILGAGAAIAVVATGTVELGMATIDLLAKKSDEDQAAHVGRGLMAENALQGVTLDPKTGAPRAMTDEERVKALKAQLGDMGKGGMTPTEQAWRLKNDENRVASGTATPQEKSELEHIRQNIEATKRLTRVMEALEAKMHGQSYDPSVLSPQASRSHPLPPQGAGR